MNSISSTKHRDFQKIYVYSSHSLAFLWWVPQWWCEFWDGIVWNLCVLRCPKLNSLNPKYRFQLETPKNKETIFEFFILDGEAARLGIFFKIFWEKSGHAVASQLRANVFNEKDLSCDTKLTIHRLIFRPTILYAYGRESWVDSGYLVYDLKMADMNVLRMIAGTNQREQWEYHIRNDDIRRILEVESVEDAARKFRLRVRECAEN